MKKQGYVKRQRVPDDIPVIRLIWTSFVAGGCLLAYLLSGLFTGYSFRRR